MHNLGRPPRMLVLLHLDGSADRPATGDPVLADKRTVGRLGTVVDHVDLGPIALALVKRGLPADTALVTGPGGDVAAVIDPDSLPPADVAGAGGSPLSGSAALTDDGCWSGQGRQRVVSGTVNYAAGQ
ncbi:folate-binding YgfZ domain protein [Mycobacterium xenopi 4042]|uniref:Folate-binding YgfZ domain protein n=1 Tax=Mycobacterium xenopi 4042 TaxID=1299334 RepID=X7ZY01_MYCXE|nr:folate-binding YgfZ domain protein [Mycobacterium xenopi 4042]